jgi:aquaporin Z
MATTTDDDDRALQPTRYAAEAIGTFVLVLGGCGAAVLAGTEIGFLGVSFAFGLSLLAMAYAIGHLSGCHVNPAVSVGLAVAGRLPWRDVPGYVVAQVLGAIAAAWVLYVVATGAASADQVVASGFAANGYGAHSPGGYSLEAALVIEVVLTAVLVFTVLSATSPQVAAGFAGIPIGLVLTLIHLVGIPVTNTSVNPARSTGPALVVGGWAIAQLWAFWVAPIAGGLLGAGTYRALERFSTERLASRQRDRIAIRKEEAAARQPEERPARDRSA